MAAIVGAAGASGYGYGHGFPSLQEIISRRIARSFEYYSKSLVQLLPTEVRDVIMTGMLREGRLTNEAIPFLIGDHISSVTLNGNLLLTDAGVEALVHNTHKTLQKISLCRCSLLTDVAGKWT